MDEQIIRIIEEVNNNGIKMQVVETKYEFGTHFVFMTNGVPGFHSTDLDRVVNYMHSWLPKD